ncbi:hypothetical protein AA313_de0204843 [Arthrobotrys entomopaga]|nr:hypothetical protein AA313_de0204843 [Arthrobotrys entomopaga]
MTRHQKPHHKNIRPCNSINIKQAEVEVPFPNEYYAVAKSDDVLVILNVDDDRPFSLTTDGNKPFAFPNKTLLVYSETIVLESGTFAYPGKNIGLFCRTLDLKSYGTDKSIIVNVSGGEGDTPVPVVKGPGGNGTDGQEAGNIWLYVESGIDNLDLNGLNLRANGGDGGDGGDTSAPNENGGTGGSGANGGNISLVFGSAATKIMAKLEPYTYITVPPGGIKLDPPNPSWWEGSKFSQYGSDQGTSVLFDLELLNTFSQSVLKDFTNTLTLYNSYANSLMELSQTLDAIINIENPKWSQPTPSEELKEAAKEAKLKIDNCLKDAWAPESLETSDSTSLNILTEFVANWSAEGTEEEEPELIDAIKSLQLIKESEKSKLNTSYRTVIERLDVILYNTTSALETCCIAIKGQGGSGGRGGIGGSFGKRGDPGLNGEATPLALNFDGGFSDMDIDKPYAFPAQCRMLLNMADSYYFTNNTDDQVKAYDLYSRLCDRLAFVPNLNKPIEPAKDGQQKYSRLLTAYAELETPSTAVVSIGTFNELGAVYSAAMSRRNQLMLKLDMFGHTSEWSPRLSFKFYSGEVDKALNLLKDVETDLRNYEINWRNQEALMSDLRAARAKVDQNIYQAQQRSKLLKGDNGLLLTSADQVVLYTPILKEKRVVLKALIEDIIGIIQNSLRVNPQNVLDALAMFASGPPNFLTAIKFTDAAYKSWTHLTDIKGVSVEKSYIINQFKSCENSISSLEQAFSTRTDGSLAVDDPGASKIIGTAEQLKLLTDDFKKAIPESKRAELSEALDDYITLITNRNGAVITYNAALQLLREAQEDEIFYGKQRDALGSQGAETNPQLPSIVFFLKKTQDDLRLDIMQRLNYESRAVRFWGLKKDVTEFSTPGPLRNATTLEGEQFHLDKLFEDCLTSYAANLWSFYPSQNPLPSERGQFIALDKEDVENLKQGVKSSDGTDTIYGTVFTWKPNLQKLSGQTNIRLRQFRVWIPKAKAVPDMNGAQQITVQIKQLGDETILNPKGDTFSFSHEAVGFPFTFNAAGVESAEDCITAKVFGTQSIEADYNGGTAGENVFAPIGPFASWRIRLYASQHIGLDLSAVENIYIEIFNRSMGRDPSLNFVEIE